MEGWRGGGASCSTAELQPACRRLRSLSADDVVVAEGPSEGKFKEADGREETARDVPVTCKLQAASVPSINIHQTCIKLHQYPSISKGKPA